MLEFSAHAKEQLKRRGISKLKVKDVINNPDEKQISYKNRDLYRKMVGGKTLEVVTVLELDKIIVITSYYL